MLSSNLDELCGVEKPVIGMPATIVFWSDSHPATVIEIPNEKTVIVQQDNSKIVKGSAQDGSAEYEYSPDPAGRKYTFTKRKNGKWAIKGSDSRNPSVTLSLGFRRRYYCPSF